MSAYDSEQFRRTACEARERAGHTTDLAIRKEWMMVAREFDHLARWSEFMQLPGFYQSGQNSRSRSMATDPSRRSWAEGIAVQLERTKIKRMGT